MQRYPESERVRRLLEELQEVLQTCDDRMELASVTSVLAQLHTQGVLQLLQRTMELTATATTPAPPRRAMTIRAAAERLAVSEDTVREYIRTGELPVTRHGRDREGRTLRIEPDDVEDLVARRSSGYGVHTN